MSSAWARSSANRSYTRSTWACSSAISAFRIRDSDTALLEMPVCGTEKDEHTRSVRGGEHVPGVIAACGERTRPGRAARAAPDSPTMTRIVAGRAGGRRLRVPARGTRPTSERIRAALFNALEAAGEVAGARVLDLYAGSGALGLEALSRGAADAVFVESDRRAVEVLRANVRALGLGGSVRHGTVRQVLEAAAAEPFDLVVADPPYGTPDVELRAVLTALVS